MSIPSKLGDCAVGKDEGDILTEPDMPHDSKPDGQSAGTAAGQVEVQSDSKLESELASGAGAAKSKGKKAVVRYLDHSHNTRCFTV